MSVTHYVKVMALAGLVFSFQSAIQAQTEPISQNTQLLGTWNGAFDYADLWGYTDPLTGREYALLVARLTGLHVIDITDPRNPVQVGFVASGGVALDVKVYKQYAIVINANSPAQIIDIADPANPTVVSTVHVGEENENGGAHNCYVDGDYLYVVGNNGAGGLIIYELSDPSNPRRAGEFQPSGFLHDIYVYNDIAYVPNINTGEVFILDVSDKDEPRPLSSFSVGGAVHSVWTTDDANHLFVSKEQIGDGTTLVFDISDLNNVKQVAEYVVNRDVPAHNFYIQGNLLFLSHLAAGLRVVDISDPTQPIGVGFYDTFPDVLPFRGLWGVYVFESGVIIVSDRDNGLLIIRQLDPTVLVANFMNGNTDSLKSRVYLWNPSESAGNVSVRVFTLEPTGSSTLLGMVDLGSLGPRSALNIKLDEDILTSLVPLPYKSNGGNLTLEFTIGAAGVRGAAQVFDNSLTLAFGTYPLQAVPSTSAGSPTVLVANFLNGNTDLLRSRIYLFNPSASEGNVTVRVYTLPPTDGQADELTTSPHPVGTLAARSALNIRLEDILDLVPEITRPYMANGGNLILEFTIGAADVIGAAQVFDNSLTLAFGTYPLQVIE